MTTIMDYPPVDCRTCIHHPRNRDNQPCTSYKEEPARCFSYTAGHEILETCNGYPADTQLHTWAHNAIRTENRLNAIAKGCIPKTQIMLSIHPKYWDMMVRREKLYEFRRTIPKEALQYGLTAISFYVTSPVRMVVGYSTWFIAILQYQPEELCEITKYHAGISRDEFFRYFRGCETAYAYKTYPIKFTDPQPLPFKGVKTPPQSWCYMKEESNE